LFGKAGCNHHENSVLTKKGEVRTIRFYNTTIRAGGKAIGILSSGEDTTERKTAEKKMMESEAMYRMITDRTSDMISVLTFESNPKYVYLSPAHERLLGYSVKKLVGRPGIENVHPDDRKKLVGILKMYLKERLKKAFGMKGKFYTENLSYRAKDAKGKYRYIESTADVVGDHIIMIARDVTDKKKSEKALLRSKEEYERIFDNLPYLAFTLDRNARVVEANRIAEEFSGLKLNEHNGIPFSDIGKMTRRETIKAMIEFRKNLGGKVTERTVYRIKLRNGQDKLVELVGIPLEENGKVARVLITGRDVTFDEKAEAEIMKSEAKYQNVFDASNDAIVIYDKSTGKVIDSNRRATEMFGSPEEETFRSSVASFISGDSTGPRKGATERTGKSGKSPQVFEWRTRNKSGEGFWAEVSLKKTKFGGEDRSMAVIRDITYRKRSEDAIRESEHKLRSILSSMVDTVFVFDKDGRLIYRHEPSRDGTDKPEMIGKRYPDVLPEDLRKLFEGAFEKSRKGRVAEFEYSMGSGERKRWYHAKVSPMSYGNRFEGSVSVIEDMTDQKKTEEDIKKRHEELERFNRLAVGRELRMIELKKRVREMENMLKRHGPRRSTDGNDENSAE
jgi:PAS domain S-box-containing protein